MQPVDLIDGRIAVLVGIPARPATTIVRHLQALVEQIVLSADVVIQRRLGDAEFLGNLIQRGIVKSLLVENACRNSEQHASLLLALLVLGGHYVLPSGHRLLLSVEGDCETRSGSARLAAAHSIAPPRHSAG